MPDDRELVRQIGLGDPDAFEALLERHARYLFGIAQALVGNADAEDLVQETFAAILQTRFRGEASVRTWLVQILVRRAGMLHRSRARRERWHAAAADGSSQEVRSTPGADARMDLTTMLESLTPEHRAVIVLREIQGLSYEEMASALGVPRGTVESRLHRAREELRRRYEGYLTEGR